MVLVVKKSPTSVASVKTIIHHESEGWVQVKLKNGKKGFIPERKDFYMGYYSYDPAHFCPEDHPCGPTFLQDLKSAEKVLTNSFNKYCEAEKSCSRLDNSQECAVTKKVWLDFKEVLPHGAQCAVFSSSQSSCGEKWGGSFSCSCKVKNVEESLYYSFSCSQNEQIDCKMNISLKKGTSLYTF